MFYKTFSFVVYCNCNKLSELGGLTIGNKEFLKSQLKEKT